MSAIFRTRERVAGPRVGNGSGADKWGDSGHSVKEKPTELTGGRLGGSLHSINSSGKRSDISRNLSVLPIAYQFGVKKHL